MIERHEPPLRYWKAERAPRHHPFHVLFLTKLSKARKLAILPRFAELCQKQHVEWVMPWRSFRLPVPQGRLVSLDHGAAGAEAFQCRCSRAENWPIAFASPRYVLSLTKADGVCAVLPSAVGVRARSSSPIPCIG